MSNSLFNLPENQEPTLAPAADVSVPEAGKRRFKSGERHQIEFVELSLDDRVPEDHPVRMVDAWVDAQDLSELCDRFRAVEGGPGRTPIHPGVLLKLWIFATLEGIGSARKISRLIGRDDYFCWLAGGLSICHRVLSEFRCLDGDFLERLLVASVADLLNTGMVTMHSVAQDGMRVRASAGKSSFHRKAALEQLEQQVQEQLKALRDELDHPAGDDPDFRRTARRMHAAQERLERIQKAQEERNKLEAQRAGRSAKEPEARASTTDPESRVMKMANGGFNPAYNVQFVTDVGSGMILYAAVVNQGTDAGQVAPALTMMSRAYGRTPGEFLADGGFATRENIDSVAAWGGVAYMPIRELKKKEAKGHDPYAPQKGDSEAVKIWRRRMATDAAREKYKLRCQTAEWINAQTRNHGFQQMPVRGLQKTRCIALLQAVAHNVQRVEALKNNPRQPE